MKWYAISGSWRQTSLELVRDVRSAVAEVMERGDGVVAGGALGVDYIATEEALKLNPEADRIKVILPSSLENYAAHFRRRADEGVIAPEQAESLIAQLSDLRRRNKRALVEMNNDVLNEMSYYDRNSKVLESADELLAFQVNGSLGVQDAIDKAKKLGLGVILKNYEIKEQINKMNPKVDWYFNKAEKWRAEVAKLREIALDSGLAEELKWGCPCYTHDGANVVLIHMFKDYCAFLFMKGALLKDVNGILVQQTENVQSARQIRFTGLKQIVELEPVLKAYIREAVEVEKAGLKVEFKKHADYLIPEELQRKMDEIPALRPAFEALTPGRQRAYILYFSAPKLSVTREARVEKCADLILDGMGLND